LLGGYDCRFLSDKIGPAGIEWRVVPELLQLKPDVLVIHGYNQVSNLLAILLSQLVGTRTLMRGDTRVHHGKERSKVRTTIKRCVFKMVSGFVAIGTANAKYYQSLGVQRKHIFFAPFSVDNQAFQIGEERPEARRQIRSQFGIPPEATVVLFASKLTARKRAIDLVDAMKSVAATDDKVMLLIVGTGPDEGLVRIAANALGKRVCFVGFRNQSEMPAFFAAADMFVLPSEAEPWGLVVNEAMAAGLPVIVSDDVGAAEDLVAGKDTGIVYPVGHVASLTSAISILASNLETRNRMGRNACELIQRWGLAATADGIAAAAHAVVR